MCDTMVSITDDGLIFAKNSDRDPNEAQFLDWSDAESHQSGGSVSTTWVEIAQVEHTATTLISRPWWMWGAEMGANEHGVTIGNEAVFTREPMSREPGLLGMDLLRLALERATNTREAVEVIVALLEKHGQSGSCSYEHPKFTYHNSFIVADQNEAIVLETAGRHWATEQVTGRGRSISNGLTIEGFADKFADRLRGRVAACQIRQPRTQAHAEASETPLDLMTALRDNGTSGSPHWSRINGSMTGPNMHAGGYLASSQTVSSWVSDLRAEPQHWSTACANPSTALFLPIHVNERADLGPRPTNQADPSSWWWQHEELHRLTLRDAITAERIIGDERDRVQERWFDESPSTTDAIDEAAALHTQWLEKLADLYETRPRWVQRRWRGWDKAAQRKVAA